MQIHKISKNANWRFKKIVIRLCGLLALMYGPCVTAQATELRVVATVKPIHSLVAGIMDGVGEPELLISGNASPHHFSLRPTDVRRVTSAEILFWIGRDFETFLPKLLKNLKNGAQSVPLAAAVGIEAENHTHKHKGHDRHEESHPDLHVWLSPDISQRLADVIMRTLAAADPLNKAVYQQNSAKLKKRLSALSNELRVALDQVKAVPYIVTHDAYGYFERDFGTNKVGSVFINPERRPGAQKIRNIRQQIQSTGAVCIFSEPQLPTPLLETVTDGLPIRRGQIDPLGAAIPAGPDMYFKLLRKLARDLRRCLADVPK